MIEYITVYRFQGDLHVRFAHMQGSAAQLIVRTVTFSYNILQVSYVNFSAGRKRINAVNNEQH